MRYRQLGESGLTVSVIGLGTNNVGSRIGPEDTRKVVDAAIDSGVTLVDTADIYGDRGGSEELLGQVLVGRREQVILATKFGMEVTVAGLAAMPAVTSVIAGATKPEQVRANAEAGEWELSAAELAELRSVLG